MAILVIFCVWIVEEKQVFVCVIQVPVLPEKSLLFRKQLFISFKTSLCWGDYI